MANKSVAPLLALGALGAGLAVVLSSKKASALPPGTPSGSTEPWAPSTNLPVPGTGPAPGTPGTTTLPSGSVVPAPSLPATSPPSGVQSVPVTINGHPWKLVPITGQSIATVDVYAPAGSWGPHAELRVCRFTQVSSNSPRVLAGVASGVPEAVLQAALKDLEILVPSSGPAATTTTPAGKPAMPASLQQEIVSVMTALGVDSGGVVRGPVTAEAVQHATELSSRLEQAGYTEAAAALRNYAQQGAKLLPQPAPVTPPVPGIAPQVRQAIDRALQLERDPAKLEALKAALEALPASAERDMLIGALDALILQIRTAQVISQTATEIEQVTNPPLPLPIPSTPTPVPSSTTTGTRILKLVSPNMKGDDVKAWQEVLRSSGYNIDADGVFGPATDAATMDWQQKRGLTPDGDVGPATRAKIGTPPTAPLTVPATPAPRPDPAPKSQIEVAAESVANHLNALQQKHGVAGSKGKQDLTLVKRFQGMVGGTADGLPGANTILALAQNGVGVLPAVMYWPKAGTKAKDLPAYRQKLQAIANAARAAGKATLAAQIEASAARETGAGGLA
jgi:peptidoglycan hydrolase-like protein with peptidoglycan-binding domain